DTGSSSEIFWRRRDFSPSMASATSAACASPSSVDTVTPSPTLTTSVTVTPVRKSAPAAIAAFTNVVCRSDRWVTKYGPPYRARNSAPRSTFVSVSAVTASRNTMFFGWNPSARTCSSSPHDWRIRAPCGPICRPAPTSPNSFARSNRLTAAPLRASASAVAAPPIPPPAMMTCVPSSFDIDISLILCASEGLVRQHEGAGSFGGRAVPAPDDSEQQRRGQRGDGEQHEVRPGTKAGGEQPAPDLRRGHRADPTDAKRPTERRAAQLVGVVRRDGGDDQALRPMRADAGQHEDHVHQRHRRDGKQCQQGAAGDGRRDDAHRNRPEPHRAPRRHE